MTAGRFGRRRFLAGGAWAALGLPLAGRVFAAGLPADPVDMSALELSAAIRGRHLSCVEAMEAYLRHIRIHNPVYNAIVGMRDDDALLAEARRADRDLARGRAAGWMHGMPHAVKDLSPVAGLLHTSGSPLHRDRIAARDGPLAARIRAAGAIFIGKTNTPEFGLGSQTYNPVFGSTGCAWNPALTAGGSSGGAACGLAARMLPAADGSDMMGSLRNPAAFNNVIGFRPSAARADGSRGLSTAGPMGRNTADAVALLRTIAAADMDPVPLDLAGARIGWLGDLDRRLPMEPGVLALCEAALAALAGAGAVVEEARPRLAPEDLWRSWTTLRHLSRAGMAAYYDDPGTRAQLKPELVWEIEESRRLAEDDRTAAEGVRREWFRELDRLFGRHDFLALPSAQVFPFSRETPWPRAIDGRPMDTYHRWMEVTVPASLGGLPVISVPAGFDGRGRPMGMQLMAGFGRDERALALGLACEDLGGHLRRRPALVAAVSRRRRA